MTVSVLLEHSKKLLLYLVRLLFPWPLLSGLASLVPSITRHCRWPRLLSVGKHSALPAPERPCLLWLPRRPRLTLPSGPWEAFFLHAVSTRRSALRSRSPALCSRSPALRSRSPALRSRSPALRSRSPALCSLLAAWAPLAFRVCISA